MGDNNEKSEDNHLAGRVADKVMQNLRQPLADIKSQLIGIANTADRAGCIFLSDRTTKITENYNFYDY